MLFSLFSLNSLKSLYLLQLGIVFDTYEIEDSIYFPLTYCVFYTTFDN